MVPAILAKVDCAGSGRRHPQKDSGGTLTSGWGVLQSGRSPTHTRSPADVADVHFMTVRGADVAFLVRRASHESEAQPPAKCRGSEGHAGAGTRQ